MTQEKLATQATKILYKYGQQGLDLARKTIEEETIPHQPLQEATRYFMACFEDVLHPALLALACEAVGGKAQDTVEVGAALVLLAGGADLHDDIIDGSTVKDSKPTVLGKYGKDLTILAGDALLFEGLYLLHKACGNFSNTQKEKIIGLVKDAFYGLSAVEAKDASLRGKLDEADHVLEMIKAKSSVTEATMKIGALIGKGTTRQSEILGTFGQTFSVLFALRDEFIDTFEVNEVANRYKNECLPLPILVSCKSPATAEEIDELLSKELTEADMEKLLGLVLDSKETGQIRQMMRTMEKAEKETLDCLNSDGQFRILLEAMIEDI